MTLSDSNQSLKERYRVLDFSASYSANIPSVFAYLDISLAFTSYQAGRLMFVRSDGDSLDINYKQFHRPMGLVSTDTGLTLGTFTQVLHFQREDGLLQKIKEPLQRIEEDVTAPRLSKKTEDTVEEDVDQVVNRENLDDIDDDLAKQRQAYIDALYQPVDERVDSCFITRSAHYSGMINIHDVDWGNDGLWVVNSSFSCLCTLDPSSSFVPRWKPHFITELAPEDRCHLNGMALKDGYPAFVTSFSTFNQRTKWRQGEKAEGTLMSVAQNEVLIDGLLMPHSPRWYQGKVYFCNSGLGQLCTFDPLTGHYEVVAELPGFTRGIDFHGSLLFLGLSKVRSGNVAQPMPLAEKYEETWSGIWVFDITTMKEVGHIRFSGNVDQIYDIAVLGQTRFPELIEPNHPRMRNHFCFNQQVSGLE